MKRRGVLGFIGAIGLSPKVDLPPQKKDVSPGLISKIYDGADRDGAGPTGFFGDSKAENNLWRILSKRSKSHHKTARMRELQVELLGGWPPHIASMHSNALWFRAHRAAKWYAEKEAEQEDFMTRLRVGIFGYDPFER